MFYREDNALRINITDYTNIDDFSEIAHTSGVNSARSAKPSFFNVLINYMPNPKAASVNEARARFTERKEALNQMLEKLRAESDARRQEFYSILINKDEDEKPYDVTGKCLDIARRIMRGETVSAEEMQFLSRYFPELLFQALLLKHDKTDSGENESPSKNDDYFEITQTA